MVTTKRALLVALALLFAAALAFGTPPAPETGTASSDPIEDQGGKYNEAPMLAALVAAGDLPPVDDRLPTNPKVSYMIEGIGNYGGELNVFATTNNIWQEDLQGQFGNSLFRIPVDNPVGLEGDLAEGLEINDERTVVTVFLREGLKWSDGAPFTSEDIRFMHEDMHGNPEVATWGNGGVDAVEVVDDFTIKMISPEGLGTIPLHLSAWRGTSHSFQPAAYLKNWHLDYNEDAQELAEEEGFDTWPEALRARWWFAPQLNVDKPQIEPWELTEITDTIKIMERNPYFWRVDPEGNQLPYIDKVVIQIVTTNIYTIKVAGGEASIAYARTTLEDLPIYAGGSVAGDFQIKLHPSPTATWMKMMLSGMFNADPVINELFNDLDFRHAISVALNRDEINTVIYQGLGKPRAVAPLEDVSFYQEGWATDFAQFDPDLANRLLDSVGLDERDAEGFRLLPDGRPFNFIIDYSDQRWTPELELYAEYYGDVDIRTIIKLEDPSLMQQRMRSNEVLAWVHNNPSVPHAGERNVLQNLNSWGQGAGPGWSQWVNSHSDAIQSTLPEGEVPAVGFQLLDAPDGWEYPDDANEPPQYWKEELVLGDQWINMEPGTAEWSRTAIELFDTKVKRFTMIGAVGEVPSPIIAKNNLGNVVTPEIWPGIAAGDLLMLSWMDQLYWK